MEEANAYRTDEAISQAMDAGKRCVICMDEVTLDQARHDDHCPKCRKSLADAAKEARSADFYDSAKPAMKTLLDEIEPAVESWSMQDVVADLPWRLTYSTAEHEVSFDRSEREVRLAHEEWTIYFDETTPPAVVKAALEAALKA